MELQAPIPFPRTADAAESAALTEIEVAIALVVTGAATRVRVAGVTPVIADQVVGVGAARAGSAGVRFVMERSTTSRTFTVGPAA